MEGTTGGKVVELAVEGTTGGKVVELAVEGTTGGGGVVKLDDVGLDVVDVVVGSDTGTGTGGVSAGVVVVVDITTADEPVSDELDDGVRLPVSISES